MGPCCAVYDLDVEADKMLVRSLIVRSLDDLKATKLVMSEPMGDQSRDDRQVVRPGEIVGS